MSADTAGAVSLQILSIHFVGTACVPFLFYVIWQYPVGTGVPDGPLTRLDCPGGQSLHTVYRRPAHNCPLSIINWVGFVIVKKMLLFSFLYFGQYCSCQVCAVVV